MNQPNTSKLVSILGRHNISVDTLGNVSKPVSNKEKEEISFKTYEVEEAMTPLRVKCTQMYLISYEELLKRQVCKVYVPKESGHNSPNDFRLGPTDYDH